MAVGSRLVQRLPENLFFVGLVRRLVRGGRRGGFGFLGRWRDGQFRRLVHSPPMSQTTTFKCLNCKEKHRADPRNRGRQSYCSKPECRKASKVASQRQWLSRPENENYFRGADACERVRRWRAAHPGYWRNKKSAERRYVTRDLQVASRWSRDTCRSRAGSCVTRSLVCATRSACGTYLGGNGSCVTRGHRRECPPVLGSRPGHPAHEARVSRPREP